MSEEQRIEAVNEFFFGYCNEHGKYMSFDHGWGEYYDGVVLSNVFPMTT